MAAKQKRLVIGNWKMYVGKREEAFDLAKTLKRRSGKFNKVAVAVAPPVPFLFDIGKLLKGSLVQVGAQNISHFEDGAHTGSISAAMAKSSGATFSIIGHSEVRVAGETDVQVGSAMLLCAQQNLTAVLCVGEKVRDHDGDHFELLSKQLEIALGGFPKTSAQKLVIAYEPVWAIGKTASDAMKPETVRETAIFIQKILVDKFGRDAALKIPILYGGSVEAENAQELIAHGGISGFLVGHASVDPDQFLKIISACAA